MAGGHEIRFLLYIFNIELQCLYQTHFFLLELSFGHTDILLRERGTRKLHIFTGDRLQADEPKGLARLDA